MSFDCESNGYKINQLNNIKKHITLHYVGCKVFYQWIKSLLFVIKIQFNQQKLQSNTTTNYSSIRKIMSP